MGEQESIQLRRSERPNKGKLSARFDAYQIEQQKKKESRRRQSLAMEEDNLDNTVRQFQQNLLDDSQTAEDGNQNLTDKSQNLADNSQNLQDNSHDQSDGSQNLTDDPQSSSGGNHNSPVVNNSAGPNPINVQSQQVEHQNTPVVPRRQDPNTDLLSQMKRLMDNMASTISNSMDSMESKIEDSKVSLEKHLTNNINAVNLRVDNVQKNVEVSLQSFNERLLSLEKSNTSSPVSSANVTQNRPDPVQASTLASTTSIGAGSSQDTSDSNTSTMNETLFKQLSQTLSDLNARRKLIDLPKFCGEPQKWPEFIARFNETTKRENYSTVENNLRLGKALDGEAHALVRSLLYHHSNVPVIIERLRQRFGLPEHLVESQMASIRRFEAISENNLKKIVPFADEVMNLKNFLEGAKCAEYLNSPQLLKDLIKKLPYRERITWTHYAREIQHPTIKEFSDWLIVLADDIHSAMFEEPQEKSKKKDRVFLMDNVKDGTCICCTESHSLDDCNKFKEMSYKIRIQTAKKNGICFCCLKIGHIIPHCLARKKCVIENCSRMHHILLHKNIQSDLNANAESFLPATTKGTAMSWSTNNQIRIWFKVVPVVIHGPKGSAKVFALIDEGASVTMMNRDVAEKIGASGVNSCLNLKWLDNASKQIDTVVSQLKIAGTFDAAKEFQLNDVHIVDNMKLPHQTLSLNELPTKYQHLKRLPIQEFHDAVPSILIGLDNSHLGKAKKVSGVADEGPIPVLTNLGYIVYGSSKNMKNQSDAPVLFAHNVTQYDDIHQVVADYLATENFGVKHLPTLENEEDLKAKLILEKTTCKIHGRYQSGLLWKDETVRLPNSFSMALNRFYSIERKMMKDPSYGELYRSTIEDYVKKGYAKKLTATEVRKPKGPLWYLPHFGVKNPNKPNKFRLVFDAAATVSNISLNSELMSGPDVNQPLVKVLSLFREKEIGVCADIKEMYHQIIIRPEDRDAQRFIWRSDSKQPLDIMRMEVMTFGSTSSPATAQFVKNLNAVEFENQHEEASRAVRENHYVDDYVHCFATEEEAIRISREVKMIHKEGGFELRNFVSNSRKVSTDLNEDCSKTGTPINLDVGNGLNSVDKILGLCWDHESDEFTFQFKFNKIDVNILELIRMPSKREFLSIVMSVFDPFGFLSNFMVHMKILLQKLWKTDLEWDDEIPEEFHREWTNWVSELKNVGSFRVPRCINATLFESKCVEWHTFVDASELAFAAVSYVRVTRPNGDVSVSYICGKAKSAPLKQLSIPRMELQAAVMGVRMKNSMSTCQSFKVDKYVFWSDSKTVLHWIKDNRRRYKQFVSNRIGEIIETTEPDWWYWVPSKDNVADDATKANKTPRFNEECRWLDGPEWLRLGVWPTQPTDLDVADVEAEVIRSARVLMVEVPHFPIDVTKYSDIFKLKTHLAWLLRFKKFIVAKFRKTEVRRSYLSSMEIREAEEELCRLAQKEAFSEEVNALKVNNPIKRTSSLYRSMPYLDELGLLRVYGRIDNASCLPSFSKRPIILPKQHHITTLVVKYYHELFTHQFEELTIAEIRRRYSIVNLRRILRKIKSICVQCKLDSAKPAQPMMGQLPKERLTPYIRPFSHTGVDYFGPITVSIGRRKEKRWVALFTCMTVRAVHVEVSENLSSDAFIVCLKNFVNLRGVPSTVHSDNGSNFIGAKSEIIRSQEFFENMKIQTECNKAGIKWKFNNPGDPAAGGCWERLVQSIKRVLNKLMKDVSPRVETLRCFLLEAANIVNSRPLTHIPISSCEEEPLTPNSFLLGCANSIQTAGPLDEKIWCLRKQWRVANCLKNHFWSLWIRDFLPTLTRRAKWCEKVKPLEINDVVMVCDDSVTRNLWQKGVIAEVIHAKDGQTRSAVVRIGSKLLRRPVSKLALLDIVKSPWTSDLPGGGCRLATLSNEKC